MHRIILLLFVVSFFLDLSFIPSLLGSNLAWPYFTISLLISLFVANTNAQINIVWVILSVLFLNTILPLNIFFYFIILIIIWGVIYFMRSVFFNEEAGHFRNNFSFVVGFILFDGLFFIGKYILNKISGEEVIHWQEIGWQLSSFQFFINIIIYNCVYKIIHKLCGKNIQVLR